jgi:hypothetical protein
LFFFFLFFSFSSYIKQYFADFLFEKKKQTNKKKHKILQFRAVQWKSGGANAVNLREFLLKLPFLCEDDLLLSSDKWIASRARSFSNPAPVLSASLDEIIPKASAPAETAKRKVTQAKQFLFSLINKKTRFVLESNENTLQSLSTLTRGR